MSLDPNHDLSRLYRSGAQELPPTSLDQRILALARDEVGVLAGAPKRVDFMRWQVPLALAAVLVLATSLTWLVEGELNERSLSGAPPSPPAETSQAQSEPSQAQPGADVVQSRQQPGHIIESASAPPSPSARLESAAPGAAPPAPGAIKAEVASLPTARGTSKMQQAERSVKAANTTTDAPSTGDAIAPPTAQPKAAQDRSKIGGRNAATGEAVEKSAASVPGAAASAPAAPVGAMRRMPLAPAQDEPISAADDTPERWLRDIEKLRREGRDAEARALLDRFHKRFPTYPLPETLK